MFFHSQVVFYTMCMKPVKVCGLGWIEKLLAVWITLCIIIGLLLGKYLPELGQHLEIGIPIGLFLMIYPAMTKIEIGELKEAFRSKRQVGIIVFFNYAVNPFLLYALGFTVNTNREAGFGSPSHDWQARLLRQRRGQEQQQTGAGLRPAPDVDPYSLA